MDEITKLLQDNGIECSDYSITKKDLAKAIHIIENYVTTCPLDVLKTQYNLAKEPQNLAQYLKLMKKKKSLVKSIDNYEIYASDRHAFMINTSEDAKIKLVYMVQFEFNRVIGLNTVSQIKLWRSPEDTTATKMGVGKMMFFDAIMPLADGIASDNAQTSAGRRFWEDRAAEAFERGFNLYIADQNKKTFTRLDSFKKLKEKEDLIWGDSSKMMGVRLVITTKEL